MPEILAAYENQPCAFQKFRMLSLTVATDVATDVVTDELTMVQRLRMVACCQSSS